MINYRKRVVGIYLLVFFIDLVNMFIAIIAYPEIKSVFGASLEQLSWVSNSYILGLTLVIPLSRWLSHCISIKKLFIYSLLAFLIGTVSAGFAMSISFLIGGRFIQGIGGGMLIPLGQTMAYRLYKNSERIKLSSSVMLIALIVPALSPSLGGIIVQWLSWRFVFFISLPIAFLTLFLSILWLKKDIIVTEKYQSFDTFGFISLSISLVLILVGLSYLSDVHRNNFSVFLLTLGFILLFIYVSSAFKKSNPLLNLGLLKNQTFSISMLIYQFIPGIFTGVNLIAILFLQSQLEMSATKIGSMMILWAFFAFLAISLTRLMFNRLGPKPLIILGCLVEGIGIFLFYLIPAHGSAIYLILLAYALMGFGGSLCSSTSQSLAFIQIKDKYLTDATALWNINRQLSFCTGIALVSLLYSVLLHNFKLLEYQAFHWCFLATSCSVFIPILFCFQLNNKSIKLLLTQEK